MMDVEVTLHTPLRINRFTRAVVPLPPTATIDTLLEQLSIEQYEVASVYVNGQQSTFSHALGDGDRVSLLPFIGGG
jgi:sulfur carrier protein ThiS